MGNDRLEYNLRAISELLEDGFSPDRLYRLCLLSRYPKLRPLAKEFAPGDGMTARVQKTIAYCKDHDLFPELLAEVERENPGQYENHASRIMVAASTAVAELPAHPYEHATDSFREIVRPKESATSNAVLHIVWGDISDLRHTTPAIPVSQNFDFWHRGPHSVLASFEKISVGDEDFFSAVERLWPSDQRPSHAPLGSCHCLRLPENSHSLPGVLFVVTTRDLSSAPFHQGRYADTPVQGIRLILQGVFKEVDDCGIQSLALPLLGIGYANIGRTWQRPELKSLLRQLGLALTIDELETRLSSRACPLRRGIVVVFSPEVDETSRNSDWKFVIRFQDQTNEEKAEQIKALMQEFDHLAEETPAPLPFDVEDKSALRKAMVRRLALGDLAVLCADVEQDLEKAGIDLQVSLDVVGGTNMQSQVLNLIQYLEVRGHLGYLVHRLQQDYSWVWKEYEMLE